ncbi:MULTISPECIES: IS1182 family transposase [Kordiimonas]|jgi:transposase|uniref:IS1182 family transposase n=1 Tax=Kordiimonas TaxID=288021 RepID=UPI00257F7BC4|nr:IS1182 family transposase [Kordiimonas sp. UBA4487]
MMGERQVMQEGLFYAFNLESHVPSDHLLRQIDHYLDLGDIRTRLEPHYSSTGRPSIDPELMIRMLIIGYCFGIRSERRLCDEVHLNLAYRWFCRLGLEGQVPNHSTFSKNRHGRFRESDILRHIFERSVQTCMAAGLVGGEGFAIDASVIEADASRFQRIEAAPTSWADAENQSRAVREYLDALDTEHSPDNPKRKPRALSPSDPCAAWTTKGRLRVQFAYGVNYLIDNDHAVIVDVEATPARISKKVASTKTMIDRTEARLGIKPQRIAADSAYGTGRLLGWLVDQGIEPHIPVWDKSGRTDGTLSRAEFSFDEGKDRYVCPEGKELKTTGSVHNGKTLLYRASKRDCDPCPLKLRCCPNTPSRKVPRDVNEHGRDVARALAGTIAFEQSSIERKKVEMLFAHLKRNMGLERLRLRGLTGARDEFHLAATVQNLRKIAKLTWKPPDDDRTRVPA